MIVLDLEIIESLGTPDKLGEPLPFDPKAQPEETTAAAANTAIGGSGFYGNRQEAPKPVAPKRETPAHVRGGGSGASAHNVIYPIEGLSPYAHKWTIKARVSYKSDIKTWSKPSGDGKLFSVNFLDETGEIRATGFNDQVDQFYELLQDGQVYYISSPCRVQLAKKQFSNLPNDYELTFERDTVVEKAEDQTSVPQVRFNFCGIQALNEVVKDTTVDVIGVLQKAGDVETFNSKNTNKDYDKRELTIVDDSGFSVRVTLWGQTATNFDPIPESVIAFKGVRVSDFNGKSLSLLSSGTMAVDPDIPEAHRLKGWYDASGRTDRFMTHNNGGTMGAAAGRKADDKNIFQVKDSGLGMGEEPEYFTLKATIVYIKQDTFCYPACSSEGCNKKVTQVDNGWRCEKCDLVHERPEYRYIMSVNVNDHTGQLWLTCFDETARVIMGGKSANELMALKDDPESEALAAAEFDAANCSRYSFRVRAKMDTFQEQARYGFFCVLTRSSRRFSPFSLLRNPCLLTVCFSMYHRVRYQVSSAGPIDYVAEAKKLADMIKQYEII